MAKRYPRRRKKKKNYTMRRILVAAIVVLLISALTFGAMRLIDHFFPGNTGPDDSNAVIGSGTTVARTDAPSGPEEDYSHIVVCLDAGHGYSDGGTQTLPEYGDVLLEKDIVLPVTTALRDALEQRGFTVKMTRDEQSEPYVDGQAAPDGRTNLSLDDRVDISNAVQSDLFISIHCDSYTDDTAIGGTRIYYYHNAKGDNTERENLSEALRAALAAAVPETDVSVIGRKGLDAYYVTRKTSGISALIELGFLTNAQDVANLRAEDWNRRAVAAIADGILAYAKTMDAAQ